MKQIVEYLLGKNNTHVAETTANELVENVPSTIKVDKDRLKKVFNKLIKNGYAPENATPFCKANKYTACFYLFSSTETKNEYALVSICSRSYNGDNFEYPIITYTTNKNSIENPGNDKVIMMKWGYKKGRILFNHQEMVQKWLDEENFEEFNDMVHKKNWYCRATFYVISSTRDRNEIYNAAEFFKA